MNLTRNHNKKHPLSMHSLSVKLSVNLVMMRSKITDEFFLTDGFYLWFY
jgi:hypothetical protein